jgi:hypothetical protein
VADDMRSNPFACSALHGSLPGPEQRLPSNAAGDRGPNAAISSHDRHTGNATSTCAEPHGRLPAAQIAGTAEPSPAVPGAADQTRQRPGGDPGLCLAPELYGGRAGRPARSRTGKWPSSPASGPAAGPGHGHGLVDAVSILRLGLVFVANMTGNLVSPASRSPTRRASLSLRCSPWPDLRPSRANRIRGA